MHRIAQQFSALGWQTEIVGILRAGSFSFTPSSYQVTRITISPSSGMLFYLMLNIQFFLKALRSSSTVFMAIDLDTLPAIRLAAWIRSKIIVWDCHEIYLAMPELSDKPIVRGVWKIIERIFVPGLKQVMTVTHGVSSYLLENYNIRSTIIHNYPKTTPDEVSIQEKFNSKIIFFQGMLNQGRGLDILIKAYRDLPSEYRLEIAGDGPQKPMLEQLVATLGLMDRVKFLGLLRPEELNKFTQRSCLGISLLDESHENSRISLANKNLDYIMGGIPTITMDFPEYRYINDRWPVAILLKSATIESIQSTIRIITTDYRVYQTMSLACVEARKVLCWENESYKLVDFIASQGNEG